MLDIGEEKPYKWLEMHSHCSEGSGSCILGWVGNKQELPNSALVCSEMCGVLSS